MVGFSDKKITTHPINLINYSPFLINLINPKMKKDLPEVITAIPVLSLPKNGMKVPLRVDDKVVKTSGVFAGKEFFEMFSFPLKAGNKASVLANKENIVLSENVAISLFGSPEKSIGKNDQNNKN